MIKTVKQACRFNPVIQDYRMSQGIENLADLINDAGDGKEFFSRNYVTHGMEQLFREGMLRLSGKSDQAVFELTQAMGGGKTHMMIALGLLAKHAHLRPEVLPTDLTERLEPRASFPHSRRRCATSSDIVRKFRWKVARDRRLCRRTVWLQFAIEPCYRPSDAFSFARRRTDPGC